MGWVAITMMAITAIGTLIVCTVVGRQFERTVGLLTPPRCSMAWWRMWALRGAAIWLAFWAVSPAVAQQMPRVVDSSAAEQVLLNGQRIETVEARVSALEALRIDTRLSLLEESRDELRTMRQWMLGILGGVIIMVLERLVGLLGRMRPEPSGSRS